MVRKRLIYLLLLANFAAVLSQKGEDVPVEAAESGPPPPSGDGFECYSKATKCVDYEKAEDCFEGTKKTICSTRKCAVVFRKQEKKDQIAKEIIFACAAEGLQIGCKEEGVKKHGDMTMHDTKCVCDTPLCNNKDFLMDKGTEEHVDEDSGSNPKFLLSVIIIAFPILLKALL